MGFAQGGIFSKAVADSESSRAFKTQEKGSQKNSTCLQLVALTSICNDLKWMMFENYSGA